MPPRESVARTVAVWQWRNGAGMRARARTYAQRDLTFRSRTIHAGSSMRAAGRISRRTSRQMPLTARCGIVSHPYMYGALRKCSWLAPPLIV